MKYTLNFRELGKNDAHLAGGKGASLGEMTQAGIPVPGGFVITAATFDGFLHETDLTQEIDAILEKVNHEAIHTVEKASEDIQALILSRPIPESIRAEVESEFRMLGSQYVAVRSSATAEDGADHAWAGQLDSFLNTTEVTLFDNVRRCWASLFTPRAIFYRFEKGLHTTHISVAVVVQSMVASEISGIAFSVHPVTEDHNQLIIEAGYGLGEAIVSGSVTPNSYVVEKSSRSILDINVSEQKRALYRIEGGGNEWRDLTHEMANSQVLNETQILELSEIILRIENHYGFPCDIEWAFEDDTFYIVQSRPITTLSTREALEDSSLDKIKKIEWQADWEGDFPMLAMVLGIPAYFDKMQEIFGVSISHFFTIHKGTVSTGYLPTKEYEAFGQSVAKQALDNVFLESWIQNFKTSADRIIGLLKEGPEFFTTNHQDLQNAYDIYGAYQIATKAAYNFLPLEADNERKQLEQARKYSEAFYHDSTIFIEKIAENIAKKNSYATHAIMALSREEIKLYFESGILPDEGMLLLRWEQSGVLWTSASEDILGSDEVDNLFLYWDSLIDVNNLKGESAYPGKVTGICRVIKNFKDATLNEGEILVTGMTDPNFVPLMKIAKAIVTDSGGLLCHAAIVARELKIPCVIGTKAATKVLHDGDQVEVDADNGVVRILNSNNATLPFPITKENSVFTFESTGTTFIFEDIVSQHYMQWESLRVAKGDNVRVFVKNEEVNRMHQEGAEMTKKFLEDKVAKMQEQSQYIKDNYQRLKEKRDLSLDELREFFKPLEVICDNYSFFDIHYSDGMLEGEVFTEAGQYVQETKNILRSILGEPFFSEEGWLKVGLRILANQFSLSAETLTWYTRADIEKLFEGKIVDGKAIDDRKLANALYKDKDGTMELFIGNEALGYFQAFQESDEETREVQGVVAHKGAGDTQGKVRVLKKDFSDPGYLIKIAEQMEEGEILVTDTTDPDFLPIMKKAGAIVTDVGGMLSHASITSRELGKLCVVGTVKGSKVLKNGDLVEVDANTGTVRILEKATRLQLKDYQKLFQWPGEFSYFLSSYFMAIYSKHQAVVMHDGKMWQSYIPLTVKEKTLKDGLDLYASENEYQELQKGIIEDFERLSVRFDEALKKAELKKEEIEKLLNIALKHYNYYSKTEFFFTDLAYTEQVNNPQIQKNFETFDNLKTKGREHLNRVALVPGCYLDKLLEKIGSQFNLSLEILKLYSIDEIIKLFDDQRVKAEELLNRNTYFFEGKDNSWSALSGGEALDQIGDFLKNIENSNTLIGQVAKSGQYIGKARVFRFSISEIDSMYSEIANMNEGEILIADTTAPEIILACKKAGAIVTNQGGMMSHAAIVARELGIPCIVGTGHATEMIRTGDTVEVDADNGVVRILK